MHPTTRLNPRRLLAILLLGTPACFLDTGHDPRPVASSIELVRGDAQTDTVDQVLPISLQVRVLDQSGAPVGGVLVRFTTDPGAGSLLVTEDSTDLSGIARNTWRLPTRVGQYHARAEATGLGTVPFRATAVPDRPTMLVPVSGDGQVGVVGSTLVERIVVRVVDRFGNGVTGVPIGFTAASGNGRVLVPLASSDAAGTAATIWELGSTPGSMRIRAKAPNIQSIPFDATALPPAP